MKPFPLGFKQGGSSWTYYMTPGNSSTFYGYDKDSFGTISPTTLEGETIDRCRGNTSGDVFTLDFSGSAQPGSFNSVDITIEGWDSNTPFNASWQGGTSSFKATVAGLATYLASSGEVGMEIVDGG